MLSFLKSLFKPSLTPLNEILISRSAILHNLKTLQSLHPWEPIFPVLKSNAYGHGIKEVATILRDTDVPYICVDSFPEYQIVRDYAKKKSLILWETLPENYLAYDPRRATLCIYNPATLRFLWESWKKRTIHLFLNTGMNREGIQQHHLPKILELLDIYPNLVLEWVMSHFANADEIDDSMDLKQIETFKNMLDTIANRCSCSPLVLGAPWGYKEGLREIWIKYIHLANSAATLKYTSEQLWCNARRWWLALYGYDPLPVFPTLPSLDKRRAREGFVEMQPALTLTSTIISTQQLQTWDIVSYAGKRTAKTPCYTATLPFWYFEGLPRNLTNQRWCHHDGLRHPQVGIICMNLSCYTTGTLELPIGTKVILIWEKKDDIYMLASLANTIPYEILVWLQASIRRTIVE
jgi:alanine racemase